MVEHYLRCPMNITLNIFLAFFTTLTLTKAAFMIAVSEALSQWKWNWFLPRMLIVVCTTSTSSTTQVAALGGYSSFYLDVYVGGIAFLPRCQRSRFRLTSNIPTLGALYNPPSTSSPPPSHSR